MSELVTGEAVVLGLRPARLPSRGLAVAVDVAVAWVTYIGISLILVSATSSMDSAAVAAASVAAFVLVQVGIPIVIETLSQGRSLGKLVCGLRVIREDGGPIRFRHALVRGAMGAIEIVMTMGVVAAIASLVSARGRRLGDVFAGTLVIRERMPVAEAGAALPPPPPWLVAELGALDLSRVPDGWWLTVRQYLARMGQLDPQVGGAMAGRLAEDLRGFTGVPAPAGVHPAAYLAAVARERQARESQRAFGTSASSAVAGPTGAAGAAPVGWGEGSPGGQPGGGGIGAGGPWTPGGPVETAEGVVTSGGGHQGAPSADGAWASPGGGAWAPETGAGAGRTRGDGAGAVGAPVQGRAGEVGDGGGGRAPRTGFAPPV
ncbi:RDD family protein [Streptomyces platensis]|uniref:RDD family protein n=1 Tax=Streptomyces platensis TaxID=58346 RepID=A0AAE6NHQ8_STRPT|nr:RDD family protein [Streptomyces platensis]QEV52843.1 RDD family protein [Streptomyces platensis]